MRSNLTCDIHDALESQTLAVIATVCGVRCHGGIQKRIDLDANHVGTQAFKPLPLPFERCTLGRSHQGCVEMNEVHAARRQRPHADRGEEGAVNPARKPDGDASVRLKQLDKSSHLLGAANWYRYVNSCAHGRYLTQRAVTMLAEGGVNGFASRFASYRHVLGAVRD